MTGYKQDSGNGKAYLLLVLSMVFWGSAFPWFKEVVRVWNPISIVFLRLTLAAFLMTLTTIVWNKWEHIHRKDWKWLALTAFCEPFAYYLFEAHGLQRIPATLGAIIMSTIPLFTPFVAYHFLRERVTTGFLAGLLLSFVGVMLIVIEDFSGEQTWGGIALMFGAVFAAIFYGVLVRKLSARYSPLTIVRMQNFFGAWFFLPLFLVFDLDAFAASTVTIDAITGLLKLSIFASFLAYFFLNYAIRHLGLNKANTFSNLIPVVSAVVAWYTIDEMFTLQKVLGIGIVIAGLLVAQVPLKGKRKMAVPPVG